MANKVDVFTEELSKVFTILQQQYVMIKYMKALITSGELDETEINKLKEQVNLINNQIQHINEKMTIIQNDITDINTNIDTIMNNQIVPIKQNIERIEQGMNTLNNEKLDKVAKTDKWQLYGVGSKVTPLPNGNTIFVSKQALPDTVINRDGVGRAQIENPYSAKDIANKDYVDNAIASRSGKIYRHTITLTNELNSLQLEYISSNNLIANSLQYLTTLLNPQPNQSYFAFCVDSENSTYVAKITYVNNIWKSIANEDTLDIMSVSDTVTPV